MKAVPALAVLGALLLAAAGCGGSGSGSGDAGGFTSSLRASGQKALDGLQYSSVPDTIQTFNTPDALLSTCTLHVQSTKPLVFRLFMAWKPRYLGRKNLPVSQSTEQVRIRFSWLAATVPASGGSSATVNAGQIPATVPISSATRRLEGYQGPAYVKPFEECELLPNGTLQGFSYGNTSTPLSTTSSSIPTTTTG